METRELEALMEGLGEVFFSLDLRTRSLVHVSPAVENLLGISREELLDSGEGWWHLFLPPELVDIEEGEPGILERGPLLFDYQVTLANGESRWIHSTLTGRRDPAGELVRLEGRLADHTARRHVEDELSARNLELHTLNRISELTLASPDLETALPELLELILEATEFPSAFFSRRDPLSQRLHILGQKGMTRPPEGVAEIPLGETLEGTAMEEMKPVAVRDAREHPSFRSDLLRRQRYRSYAAFPLVASGRVLGILTLADPEVREISLRTLRWGESLANALASFVERLDAEAALREGEAQARRLASDLRVANEELEAFAYSVSHDLRAPLRTMTGFAHALLQEHGEDLDPQARDFARRIIASGRQSEALIGDLLAYSRMSFQEMELQEVDLAQVYRDAMEQVEGQIREKGAVITPPTSFPRVLAHQATLVQVLMNLLTNAMKFVPDHRKPEVTLRWEDRGEEESIRLWVEDNGFGIPPDQQERIFKAFERLEGGPVSEGTGIGLAIVRRGMQRVGGGAGVIAEEGKGSRFWLDIPRSRARGWRPWLKRRKGGGQEA